MLRKMRSHLVWEETIRGRPFLCFPGTRWNPGTSWSLWRGRKERTSRRAWWCWIPWTPWRACMTPYFGFFLFFPVLSDRTCDVSAYLVSGRPWCSWFPWCWWRRRWKGELKLSSFIVWLKNMSPMKQEVLIILILLSKPQTKKKKN